jgi:chemotaxis protein MotB
MWMVTFADLMALLLTLFVLLLTFAEMDLVKYKQLAGALKEAFGSTKRDSEMVAMSRIYGHDGKGAAVEDETEGTKTPRSNIKPDPELRMSIPRSVQQTDVTEEEQIRNKEKDRLVGALQDVLSEKVAGSGIEVERSGDNVVLRFPQEIAFPSGSGVITQQFAGTLKELVPILIETKGELRVAGHTDNVPISGGGYRSNWDLSAVRAASVVHELLKYDGIEPKRLAIEGYGDSRPIADNATKEGQAKNRRVELIIVSNPADAAKTPDKGAESSKIDFQDTKPPLIISN